MRRNCSVATTAAVLLLAVPLSAQTVVDPDNVRAKDVVTSPLEDVNLMKRPIPVVLEVAEQDPYSLDNIRTCKGLITAIDDLTLALGEDIDVAYDDRSSDEKMGNSAGNIAKSVISGFIPFRGLVREVTGANAQQRAWERAIFAGAVRRAFLKGVGLQRKCAYPARPATGEVVAALAAAREAKREAAEKTSGEAAAVSE